MGVISNVWDFGVQALNKVGCMWKNNFPQTGLLQSETDTDTPIKYATGTVHYINYESIVLVFLFYLTTNYTFNKYLQRLTVLWCYHAIFLEPKDYNPKKVLKTTI